MAHKIKHTLIALPSDLAAYIDNLYMPGSRNERCKWLVKEGIAAHPEILPQNTTVTDNEKNETPA